jgi:ABC-2 type transport system permease protein
MTTAVIARPGLRRLAGVELRKSADTRAGFWLLIVIVLLAVALVTVQLIWGEQIDQSLTPLFQTTIEITSVVLPILGILLVTSEWSQRTGLTTFALAPQRERVIAAKVMGAVVLTLGTIAACLVIALAGNAIAGDGWELSLSTLGRFTLYELISMLSGMAFGLVFMNSALAIVMSFVVPIGWAILGESIRALDKPAEWLDLSRTLTNLAEGGMTGGDWARFATATALWIGVLGLVGLIRLRRTELK